MIFTKHTTFRYAAHTRLLSLFLRNFDYWKIYLLIKNFSPTYYKQILQIYTTLQLFSISRSHAITITFLFTNSDYSNFSNYFQFLPPATTNHFYRFTPHDNFSEMWLSRDYYHFWFTNSDSSKFSNFLNILTLHYYYHILIEYDT